MYVVQFSSVQFSSIQHFAGTVLLEKIGSFSCHYDGQCAINQAERQSLFKLNGKMEMRSTPSRSFTTFVLIVRVTVRWGPTVKPSVANCPVLELEAAYVVKEYGEDPIWLILTRTHSWIPDKWFVINNTQMSIKQQINKCMNNQSDTDIRWLGYYGQNSRK